MPDAPLTSGVGQRVGRDWLFDTTDLERMRERVPGRPVGWRKRPLSEAS